MPVITGRYLAVNNSTSTTSTTSTSTTYVCELVRDIKSDSDSELELPLLPVLPSSTHAINMQRILPCAGFFQIFVGLYVDAEPYF